MSIKLGKLKGCMTRDTTINLNFNTHKFLLQQSEEALLSILNEVGIYIYTMAVIMMCFQVRKLLYIHKKQNIICDPFEIEQYLNIDQSFPQESFGFYMIGKKLKSVS